MLNIDRPRVASFCDQLDSGFARWQAVRSAARPQAKATPAATPIHCPAWLDAVQALQGLGLRQAEAQNLVMQVNRTQPHLQDAGQIVAVALRFRR